MEECYISAKIQSVSDDEKYTVSDSKGNVSSPIAGRYNDMAAAHQFYLHRFVIEVSELHFSREHFMLRLTAFFAKDNETP